jgi:hypothetical protein
MERDLAAISEKQFIALRDSDAVLTSANQIAEVFPKVTVSSLVDLRARAIRERMGAALPAEDIQNKFSDFLDGLKR